ncbi:hypothetical protein CIB84_001465 [Bambusicola thoracicus]|uniref:Centrosomal protein of 70 kDa n=1 Tax=Bambusicola thoracicus TaxID=9083 RepID=A0A2P4TEP3_BAMTH|nr:hypothetical protein CIB84_001465 [Bambusicola thoracicus]
MVEGFSGSTPEARHEALLKPSVPDDVIALDSVGIRLALKTLLEDTDRQQKMMYGLMETNHNLRDEVRQERGRASRQEKRANELENVVENIKSKIRQLEDETIAQVCRQQNQVKGLEKDQLVSQNQLAETKARNEQLLLENTNLKKDLETRSSGSSTREGTEEKKEPKSTAEDQLHAVCQQYLQVLSNIDSIIRSPRAPPLIYRRSKGPVQNYIKENRQDCGFEHLPLTIEMWADQLVALKDLHRSLRKLSLELVPWHITDPQDNIESIRVQDLQFMVDTVLEEIENKEKNSQRPSLPTLFAIVSHFQKLFDVNSLNGIYPRMNEVYTKLGELTNAMRNLHELLELDSSVPPTVVVDTVGKLCDIINENVTEQLQRLLGTQDIHSIMNKLEEHECFFPPFQALIQDLLSLLEINNLDDILPTVQKLKLVAR